MPFGLTTAPSVYQSLNNVISTLLRQNHICNGLYIGKCNTPETCNLRYMFPKFQNYLSKKSCVTPILDDRCVLCEPDENYLGWLLVALCTCTGHFLSLHKANVQEPVAVFNFLGYEFNCPEMKLRLSNKRKIKMKKHLEHILYKEKVAFHDLERFRGMAIRSVEY